MSVRWEFVFIHGGCPTPVFQCIYSFAVYTNAHTQTQKHAY